MFPIGPDGLEEHAEMLFRKVFRTDWEQPGFGVVVLPEGTGSKALREVMVRLKELLSREFDGRWGERLEYLSMGRFDQQTTTKLHLDGAPETSLLMLGYEATSVRSSLHIADYSRCARDLGLTPAEFLQEHNPMFPAGAKLLEPYTTHLEDWHEDRSRLVLINNSSTAPGDARFSPGVMHGATIRNPDPQASRIINSTMIAPRSLAGDDATAKQNVFLRTDEISGVI
ncbi:hypothetical protein [Brevifollis gellanilyticus]|uniref:Uncharacterized protein n=1 Tax=Brevifollis gellanilyticus TaxID=748831 RepID=A0A512MAB0_9BACT|nr:hypothetical protein [Brevifollis gellanilyticus]GEP43670.1 hypothetical protein BGE01nite_29610 [Brevifollis gellanilyticus]